MKPTRDLLRDAGLILTEVRRRERNAALAADGISEKLRRENNLWKLRDALNSLAQLMTDEDTTTTGGQ